MINQKVLLKNETTYRFGGMCKNFFLLDDKKDLDNFDDYDIFDEYFILGKGSNVAFSENEFDGAVIQSKINYINFDNFKKPSHHLKKFLNLLNSIVINLNKKTGAEIILANFIQNTNLIFGSFEKKLSGFHSSYLH